MSKFPTRMLSLAAVVLAGGAVAVGAPTAFAEPDPPTPAVTVTPSTGLNPDGDTVTVSGTGFTTADGTSGVYVALAARDHFSPTNAAAYFGTKWVHVGGPSTSSQAPMNPDGSFSTTLSVTAVFGSDDNATDCRTTQCAIFTLAAHGSPDRSQDTATDVNFISATVTSTTTETPPDPEPTVTTTTTETAPDPEPTVTSTSGAPVTGPAVTVTPRTGLDPAGTTVTVSGTGFKTTGTGIYVGLAARNLYSPTNADAFGAVTWLGIPGAAGAPAHLNADGSFSITLTLEAVFGSGTNATDCTATQCAIFTLAAHGVPDRSQDTATDVAFGDTPLPSGSTTGSGSPTPSSPVPSGSKGSGSATLSDSTVAPGGSTSVEADGFEPGEQVQAVLHSEPLDLGVSPADSAGVFRLKFTVPLEFESGAHTLVLTGLSSSRVVTVPLTVVATADPSGSTAGGPDGGVSPAADSGDLAATGTNSAELIALGLALLIGGGALSVALRRPRRARLH